jgi:hypothetical protein
VIGSLQPGVGIGSEDDQLQKVSSKSRGSGGRTGRSSLGIACARSGKFEGKKTTKHGPAADVGTAQGPRVKQGLAESGRSKLSGMRRFHTP